MGEVMKLHGTADMEFTRYDVSFKVNDATYPVMSISYGEGEPVIVTMRSSAARFFLLKTGGRGRAVVRYSHPEIGEDSDELDGLEMVACRTEVPGADRQNEAIFCTLRGKCARILWTEARVRFDTENS